MVEKKDPVECKEWLKNTHPLLYDEIWGEADAKKAELAASEEKKEGAEEKKEVKPQKQKKKVGFGGNAEGAKQIKVVKNKRGKKKTICLIVGLQDYGVNLKDVSKSMGKKFACGACVATDDKYGECIQVQGDVQGRFEEFIESDLGQYNIPSGKIVYEEAKKKKVEPTE